MILKIKKIILLLFILSINSIYSNEIRFIEINANSSKIFLKEKAYVLYDDDRQYNIEYIENIIKERKVTSYFGDFTKNLIGFYNGKIWIYFQTKSQLEYEQELYLLLAPWHLDKIEIYEYSDHGLKHTTLGDLLPFHARMIKSNEFFYSFNLLPLQKKEFLISMESTSSIQIPLIIFDKESFLSYIRSLQFTYGIYIGMIIIMCIFNFFLFIFLKDIIYIFYIKFLLLLGMTILSITGYAYEFFWYNYPYFAQISNYVFENLTIISANIFMILFLNLNQKNILLYRLLIILIIYTGLSFIILFQNDRQIINIMTLINLFISSIIMLLTTIYETFKKNPYAKILLISWSILIISVIIRIMMDFTRINIDYHESNYAILIGSAIDMSLISLGLGYRFNDYVLKSKEYDMEIQLANEIYKFLFPEFTTKDLEKYIFYFQIFPRGSGGDLNWFYFKENKLIIIQIDISGHNISTSIISVILKGYLEQNVQSINIDFSKKNVTKDIVAIVHDFVKKQLKNHYLSVIVLCVDFDLDEVVISKCGHPVPILISSNSQHILLESTGSIIHPEFFIEPEATSYSLKENDTIYIYTDGLVDLILNKNKNVDSQQELIKFFKHVNLLSFTMLRELLEENYKKIHHKIQLDDISLILFKYNKEFISMIKNDLEDLNKNHNIQ